MFKVKFCVVTFFYQVLYFIMAGWIQSTARAMSFLLRVKVARKTTQRMELNIYCFKLKFEMFEWHI